MPGAVSFRRVLGSTSEAHKASQQPHCHGCAEDDQRPHNRRHPNHRNLITKTAEGTVGLEQPGLNQVSRGYRDEGGQSVHVSNGDRGCDAGEKEGCPWDGSKAAPYQSVRITLRDVCCLTGCG